MDYAEEEEGGLPHHDLKRFRELRYHKYRREIDILHDLLEIVARAGRDGIKKTRLLQLSNLNNRSFASYFERLKRSRLIVNARGVYLLSGRGRLVLTLLKALKSLLTPVHIPDDTVRKICLLAENRGLTCTTNYSIYDLFLANDRIGVGVIFASCETPSCSDVVYKTLSCILRQDDGVKKILVLIGENASNKIVDKDNIILVEVRSPEQANITSLLAEIID